jgi:hypothetical protein
MGIMKTAAVKGLIPPGNKINELRQNIYNLMVMTPLVLEEKLGQDGLNALAEVFHRMGHEDAKTMKERLGLGDSLEDSADAWKVIGHILGSKLRDEWLSESRVEFHHDYCPQYEAFQKSGHFYCSTVCLPYMESIANGISPFVRMEVVRESDRDTPCIKALTTE